MNSRFTAPEDAGTNVLVISKESGSLTEYFLNLWRFRGLLSFLALKDIKIQLARTVLGRGWIVLRPILNVLVLTIVFGRIVRIPTGEIPYLLFALTGFLPWAYFASVISRASSSLVGNSSMVTKVYFPRVYMPLSAALGCLVDFGVALAVFFVISMAFYGHLPSLMLLWLPVPLLLLLVTALGAALWLAALAVEYRDVRLATQYVLQLMMFSAPIIWPLSLLSSRLGPSASVFLDIYPFYPIAGIVEGFRASLLGFEAMPWEFMAKGFITSSLLLVSGFMYFRRHEQLMADFV